MNILIQPKSPMESLWISRVHSDRCVSHMRTRHKKEKSSSINSLSGQTERTLLMELWPAPFESSTKENYRTFLITIKINHQVSCFLLLLWRWPLTLRPINEESNQNFTMEFDADEWAARVRAFEGFTREFDSTRERRKHLEFTRKLPASFSSSPLFSSLLLYHTTFLLSKWDERVLRTFHTTNNKKHDQTIQFSVWGWMNHLFVVHCRNEAALNSSLSFWWMRLRVLLWASSERSRTKQEASAGVCACLLRTNLRMLFCCSCLATSTASSSYKTRKINWTNEEEQQKPDRIKLIIDIFQ